MYFQFRNLIFLAQLSIKTFRSKKLCQNSNHSPGKRLPSSLVLWIQFVCVAAVSHTLSECANFCATLLNLRMSLPRVIWLTTAEIHTKHKFCPHDTNLKSLTERSDFFRTKPTLNINELVRSIHYLPAAAIDTPQLQTSSFLWLRTVRVDKRQRVCFETQLQLRAWMALLLPKSVVRPSALDLIQIAKSSSMDKRTSKLGRARECQSWGEITLEAQKSSCKSICAFCVYQKEENASR